MSGAPTSEIQVARLSGPTLFRILFIGLLGFHIASTLLVMVLVLFGILPVETVEQQPPTSTILGFVAAYLLLGILFSPFWVGVTWLCVWSGLRVYAIFRPIRIGFLRHDISSKDDVPN